MTQPYLRLTELYLGATELGATVQRGDVIYIHFSESSLSQSTTNKSRINFDSQLSNSPFLFLIVESLIQRMCPSGSWSKARNVWIHLVARPAALSAYSIVTDRQEIRYCVIKWQDEQKTHLIKWCGTSLACNDSLEDNEIAKSFLSIRFFYLFIFCFLLLLLFFFRALGVGSHKNKFSTSPRHVFDAQRLFAWKASCNRRLSRYWQRTG